MKRYLSIISQTLFFVLILILILLISYVINRQYLIGDNLMGNDTYSFYTLTFWINKYFPFVPYWYPLAGGGVSLTSAYPVFAAYIVSFLSRVAPIDITQSFRLLGFLSVPILSTGVFIFIWTRLTEVRNIVTRLTLAAFAAIFVVITPNSYLWLTRWGFYAESASYIFIPFTILFFDIFLEKLALGKKDLGFRVSVASTAIFFALSFITHFFAGGSLLLFFVVWSLIRLGKGVFKHFWYFVILMSFMFGLIFFRVADYSYYMAQVGLGGFNGYGSRAYTELSNNTLNPLEMLSLTRPQTIMDPHALIFDMRFPFFVWLLSLLGFIFSFKKSKRIFAFGTFTVLGFVFSTFLPVKYFLSNIPYLSSVLGFWEDRGFLIIARVVTPVTAVYGAYCLAQMVSFKKELVAFIVTLIFVPVLVLKTYSMPYNTWFLLGTGVGNGVLDLRDIWNTKPSTLTVSYGQEFDDMVKNSNYWPADILYMRQICLNRPMDKIENGSLCDSYLKDKNLVYPPVGVFNQAKDFCKTSREDYCGAFYTPLIDQINIKNWPTFSISSSVTQKIAEVKNDFKDIDTNSSFRFDMSGFAGSVIMATPLVTQNSQIQLYINTASLIYNSWNYLSQIMYSKASIYQKPGVLTEMAKWFGLNYVYLKGNELEPLDFWKSDASWQDAGSWKKFTTPSGLAEWTNKPKILVIADQKRGIYDSDFRFFTRGAISFDKAYVVEGGPNIDSYTLSQLLNYKLIIMNGYNYKDRTSAYKILDEYIKGGGNLIFDTGWQYEVPDYILNNTPDFMPFDSLTWKNLPVDVSFDQNGFGDLKYNGGSWGVSVPGTIKSWAHPILNYAGTPLGIEGDYGRGKVVWFGFNIIPHSTAKDSQAEVKFFGQVVDNLIGLNGQKDLDMSVKRISPDKLEFTFNKSFNSQSEIYFREAYFPFWKANGFKIDKAGPGFMLISVPGVHKGDKLTLQIKISPWQYAADLLTFITFIIIIIFIARPKIFPEVKLHFKIKNPFENLSKSEDEDY